MQWKRQSRKEECKAGRSIGTHSLAVWQLDSAWLAFVASLRIALVIIKNLGHDPGQVSNNRPRN